MQGLQNSPMNMIRQLLAVWLLIMTCAVHAQPDPAHAVMTLTHAQLASQRGDTEVVLPHLLPAEDFHATGDVVRYQLTLDLPQRPREPLGIFVPKVSLGGRLFLNGELIGSCAVGALDTLRCLHRPWLLAPPVALWDVGRNVLDIEVHVDDRQMNGLSTVRVGPLLTLEQGDYAWQYFLQVQLVQALSWITVILGLLSLMVAFYLPGPNLYLWVGIASLLHALSNLNFLSTQAWPTPELFSWFAFSSRMCSVPMLLLACIALYEKDQPWQHAVAVIYAVLGPLLVWFSDNNRTWVGFYYVPVLSSAVLVLLAMTRWTWQSRKLPQVVMLVSVAVMLAAGFDDWHRLRGASAFEGVYLLAYASAGFLVVMGGLVMARLASGLLESRELTATLERKVAEREQRLAEAYERRLSLERSAAVNQERERLLADMHDSLGAGLSTAHLLLRQGQLSVQAAAYMVQECMDDLRLVFDVSANLDGSLETLVADVRHRLEGRMAAVGLQTHWDIDVQEMPMMDPSHALQLMRILQESITNVIRHAQARQLNVSLRWQGQERVLWLRVQDDGMGMPAQALRTGRGLANMARRAVALGGELDIRAANPGTVVALQLRVPSARSLV
jgi:signal transduction histidine kinase